MYRSSLVIALVICALLEIATGAKEDEIHFEFRGRGYEYKLGDVELNYGSWYDKDSGPISNEELEKLIKIGPPHGKAMFVAKPNLTSSQPMNGQFQVKYNLYVASTISFSNANTSPVSSHVDPGANHRCDVLPSPSVTNARFECSGP